MHFLFSIWLWSQNAFAETDIEKAKRLYQNGQELYDEGSYDAAILAWTEGYALSNKAGFLKNIALAYEAMGEYEEALQKLNEYRAFAPLEEKEALKEHSQILAQKIEEAAQLEQAEREREDQLNQTLRQNLQNSQAGDIRNIQSNTISNPNPDSQNEPVQKPSTPSEPLIPKSVWLKTATITGISATALTLASIAPYKESKDFCEPSSQLCLPTEGMTSDEFPWNQLMLYRNLSLGLWGVTVVTSTVALTQSTSIQVLPNGIFWQGEF